MSSESSMRNSEMTVRQNAEYQASSIIQMRLDTTKLLADMEAFLRGTRVIGYKESEGAVEPVFDKMGRARMNDIGIQETMSWISTLFNPQTVQGNKKEEAYQDFMGNLHADFAESLMMNLHQYGIDEQDYNSVVDKVMHTADMFFSRTIDNLERESYASTMKSVERSGDERKSWMDGFMPFKRER